MSSRGAFDRIPFAVLFLVLALLPAAGAMADQAPIRIEVNGTYNETTYCLDLQDGPVCLQTTGNPLNIAVLTRRSRNDSPLAAQLPALKRLLGHILEKDPVAKKLDTFFWGRLVSGNPWKDTQMSYRLSLAAYQSPDWDRTKGKPKKGYVTDFVRDTANRAGIYTELKTLFDGYGYELAFSSVEKVLVRPASELPYFDDLKKQGVDGTARLPFDGMVWFRMALKK